MTATLRKRKWTPPSEPIPPDFQTEHGLEQKGGVGGSGRRFSTSGERLAAHVFIIYFLWASIFLPWVTQCVMGVLFYKVDSTVLSTNWIVTSIMMMIIIK